MRRWTAQDFSTQQEVQVFYSKATCGRRFSASPCLFLPLVSYMCQCKKRNQGLLSFPHWPCQSFQRRQFLPHSQEMGPHGPGNSSVPANVFTQHSACSSRFARSPPLLSAPGKFYHLGGLLAAALPTSLLDHQSRQTVWLCGAAVFHRGPSLLLTEGSPADRGGLGQAGFCRTCLNILCSLSQAASSAV